MLISTPTTPPTMLPVLLSIGQFIYTRSGIRRVNSEDNIDLVYTHFDAINYITNYAQQFRYVYCQVTSQKKLSTQPKSG